MFVHCSTLICSEDEDGVIHHGATGAAAASRQASSERGLHKT